MKFIEIFCNLFSPVDMSVDNRTVDSLEDDLSERIRLNNIRQEFHIELMRSRMKFALDMVLLTLPLVAPLPNMVNLFKVMQPQFGAWSILAVIGLEAMIFGFSEGLVQALERWYTDRKAYKWLFIAISVGTGLYLIVLFVVVYGLEVKKDGDYTPMLFPGISVLSVVLLTVSKWKEIISGSIQVKANLEPMHNTVASNATMTECKIIKMPTGHKPDIVEPDITGQPDIVEPDIKGQPDIVAPDIVAPDIKGQPDIVTPKRKRRQRVDWDVVRQYMSDNPSETQQNVADMFKTTVRTLRRNTE